MALDIDGDLYTGEGPWSGRGEGHSISGSDFWPKRKHKKMRKKLRRKEKSLKKKLKRVKKKLKKFKK